jgi:hypothetical protein
MLKHCVPSPNRTRRLVRALLADGADHRLEWMQVTKPSPRGTIFAPPLVGGDGLLTIRYLRPLKSERYQLVSFNYSGHGLSSRPFSIRQSLQDTQNLLAFLRRQPRRFPSPLHGVGICYAATPLLHTLYHTGEPLPRIALINAIPQLFSRHLLHSFLDFRRTLEGQRWTSGHLGAQLHRYMEFLLPGITITHRQFGLLALRRIRMLQTLVDWLASRHLRRVRLAHTAVLCLYSSEDRLFRAFRYFDSPRHYEKAMRQICPTAEFVRLEGDHFLSAAHNRQKALQAMVRFLGGHPHKPLRTPAGSRPITPPRESGNNAD